VARGAKPYIVVCPACGRQHEWKPGPAILLDIGQASDTIFEDRRGDREGENAR
jgi:hypothetical protein